MLVPAGFLVLMLLAAIAVDSAGSYLAQRQLTDALAAAANDAATAGLDNTSYYSSGAVTLDPQAAALAVCRSLAAQDDGDLHRLTVQIGVAGAVIVVHGAAEVEATLGRIIPGFGTQQISARVEADAQQGPARAAPTPAPVLTPIDC